MFASTFAILSALALGLVGAQTPPGFTPSTDAKLDVSFGNIQVTPGLRLTTAQTASKPTIGTTPAPLNGSHILFVIDIDVPGSFFGGAPGTRTTVLHALLTDYTSSPTANSNGSFPLTSAAIGPASWFGPAPPAETPPKVHRYIELLYAQPEGFRVPASQAAAVTSRVGFNLTSFARDASLGPLLRGNYFEVLSP